jgi:hypothetical protein
VLKQSSEDSAAHSSALAKCGLGTFLKISKDRKRILMRAKYKLRYFFDYNCGGCLWSDNDAAYEKFGYGCLDSEIYDLDGNIIEEAKIKFPASIRHRVLELDILFSESLNWNDPAGPSPWKNEQ